MHRVTAIIRLAVGIVGVAALLSHLVYSLGSGGSALPNFFSYFTMQSAIAAVLLWFTGGVRGLLRATDPQWLVAARLLVTTYQLVSGAVYTIIVLEAVSRGISIQVPVSSQVLHYWLPAIALLDWLLFPGRPRARWRPMSFVLGFPLVWGAFTMVRGSLVGWYPYFFLDPYQVGSPVEFAVYSAIVLSFIAVVAGVLTLAGTVLPPSVRRARRGSAREERLETASGALDEFVVTEVGDGERVLSAHRSHEDR